MPRLLALTAAYLLVLAAPAAAQDAAFTPAPDIDLGADARLEELVAGDFDSDAARARRSASQ